MAQLTLSNHPDGFILSPSGAKKFVFDQGKEFALPCLHTKGIGFGATLVVVPQQVQDPVQQQEIELVLKGQTGFGCIAGGGVG